MELNPAYKEVKWARLSYTANHALFKIGLAYFAVKTIAGLYQVSKALPYLIPASQKQGSISFQVGFGIRGDE